MFHACFACQRLSAIFTAVIAYADALPNSGIWVLDDAFPCDNYVVPGCCFKPQCCVCFVFLAIPRVVGPASVILRVPNNVWCRASEHLRSVRSACLVSRHPVLRVADSDYSRTRRDHPLVSLCCVPLSYLPFVFGRWFSFGFVDLGDDSSAWTCFFRSFPTPRACSRVLS